MHEYDDLVKRLRSAARWSEFGLVIVPSLCLEAGKAIEELSAKLDGLQFFEENITKLPNCNTCLKKNMCEFVPRAGEYCRINCPFWLGDPKEAKDA